MLKIFEKQVFVQLLLFILIASFLSLNLNQAYAQDIVDEDPEWFEYLEPQRRDAIKQVIASPLSQCDRTLTIAFDLELGAFFFFLEENFLNESATSSLTNIAISRYAEFKTRIEHIYNNMMSAPEITPGDVLIGIEEAGKLAACATLKNEYINIGKERMVEYIKNNQAQKRTMIIVEKYKAINSRLSDMNIMVARMYGSLMEFKNRLAFFSRECVQN